MSDEPIRSTYSSADHVFFQPDIGKKIQLFVSECHKLLLERPKNLAPARPARAQNTFEVHPEMLNKPGLQSPKGQAWLLHDLANIELQAAELFLRTLHEYPDAPNEFRHELAELCLEEVEHLKLCLNGVDSLGFKWGDFPIHYNLWEACAPEDTLIDRIFIVHMYLEASGLDAGEHLLRRLNFAPDSLTCKAVRKIAEDELRHVQFGTKWYAQLLKASGQDPDFDFQHRLTTLKSRLPLRGAKPHVELRRQAGFSEAQIQAIAWHKQMQNSKSSS